MLNCDTALSDKLAAFFEYHSSKPEAVNAVSHKLFAKPLSHFFIRKSVFVGVHTLLVLQNFAKSVKVALGEPAHIKSICFDYNVFAPLFIFFITNLMIPTYATASPNPPSRPVTSRRLLVDFFTPEYCNDQSSMVVSQQSTAVRVDMFFFMAIGKPTSCPASTPVHLAHTGNCQP